MADLRIKWDPPIRTDIVDSISIYRFSGVLNTCEELTSYGVLIAEDLPVDAVLYNDLGAPDADQFTYGVFSVNNSGLSLCSFDTIYRAPNEISDPTELAAEVYDLGAEHAPSLLIPGDATLGIADMPLSLEPRAIDEEENAFKAYWAVVNGRYIYPLFADQNQAAEIQANANSSTSAPQQFAFGPFFANSMFWKPNGVGSVDGTTRSGVVNFPNTNVEFNWHYTESYSGSIRLSSADTAPRSLQGVDISTYSGWIWDPLTTVPTTLSSYKIDVLEPYYSFPLKTYQVREQSSDPNTAVANGLYYEGTFDEQVETFINEDYKFVQIKWIAPSGNGWERGKRYLREVKNGQLQFWHHDKWGQSHAHPQADFDLSMYRFGMPDLHSGILRAGFPTGNNTGVSYYGKWNLIEPPDSDDPTHTLQFKDWGIKYVICNNDSLYRDDEDWGLDITYQSNGEPYMTEYLPKTYPENGPDRYYENNEVKSFSRPYYGPWRSPVSKTVISNGPNGSTTEVVPINLGSTSYSNYASFALDSQHAPSVLTAAEQQ
jgi:hypothetical protein